MLFKNETICMVVGIAGIVYFAITIVGFIYCKIRNITCCHETHQESSTEFKIEREEGIRQSGVCGEQDPTLQRYVKNPTHDSNLRAKESDEQGEPKYDYAVTGEICRCTGNESQKSDEESLDHTEGNTSKNETETTKKADEPVVIEDTKVKRKEKTNGKRPIKRTCLKSGTVHYENETVDTSVKKANDDIENENVSDTSYVQMRKTDSASGQYENEGAKTERYGNESNVYESVHNMPDKMMTVVDIDIEANNDDCMATSDNGISDNMSHKTLNTDKENEPTSNSNYIENREKEHGKRFGKRDSYSKRESQGSGQSNESRTSDESEESNDSNKSRSTDISVRSDNTDTSVRSDNTPRESTSPTNPGQDSNAMYVKVYAQTIQIGPSTIYHLHTD
ncbi:dentin sialophosphoprotein-like isoform X2 [Mytilus californianus]|uniref:dentin sialophosphoprotein-like isoform X2 n=1 Tax=Mytilus californianus TaxID=6549 RepID=UPI002245BEBB|nr:dentin sialophosphoprotein-like isoform X2 [Mytilus californianus]